MIALKVNHLTNLHDARYCAAAPGVRVVTFNRNPQADYLMPANAVREILEWLSIPLALIDVGTNAAQVEPELEPLPPTVGAEWHLTPGQNGHQQLPNLPQNLLSRLWVTCTVQRPQELGPATQQLLNWADDVAGVELRPRGLAAGSLNNRQLGLLANHPKAYLEVDDPAVGPPAPWLDMGFGLSFRQRVSADRQHLDFDRFEDLLRAFTPRA